MTDLSAEQQRTLEQAHRHHQAGRFGQAEQLYRTVLTANSENPQANHLLGVLAYQQGRFGVAVPLIAKAVLHEPGNATYLNNLGLALGGQGKLEEALLVYRQAISIDPDYADAHVNCGIVLEALGKPDEALTVYNLAIARNPDHADLRNSRGLLLLSRGDLGQSLADFSHALGVEPGFAEAHNNRGNALEAQGRIKEAIEAYRQAIATDPGFAGAESNLLLCLQYDDDTDGEALLAAHRNWGAAHAVSREGRLGRAASGRPVHGHEPNRDPDPKHRLRIGYVSPDFCTHPVAAFVEPLLALHDRTLFDIFCYSNVRRPDDVTTRLRSYPVTWRDIRGMPDEKAAALVRDDGIDILIDLAGHTAGGRLLLFGHKPAPIQASYLGYPGTSGLTEMDHRLTDVWTDPVESSDAFYTEELVHLPGGSLCFQPPLAEVPSAPFTPPAAGHVTFASFNNAAKVSPVTVSLWSKVLEAMPNSRLLLKSRSFADRETVDRLLGLFGKHGISPERLEFAGWLDSSESHLALYDRAHIALDTFPYSGCTTTCEALWMGVPVITLAGREARSRMSVSILKQLGLDCYIAESAEAYVEIAAALAMDGRELARLRAGLRSTMRESNLMNAERFTRNLEAAYREMWQRNR